MPFFQRLFVSERIVNKVWTVILLALLVTVTLTALSSFLPIVDASTGPLLIGVTTSPSAVVNISAGGNVSIYFGSVTFSGGQFYLLWSADGFSSISSSDFKFSPVFNTVDLRGPKKLSNGIYIGNNWVNISIPTTTAGGHYYIKCFDGVMTSIAVSDNYVNLLPILKITPFTEGAGGASISLKGLAFAANGTVKLAYYDPIAAANKTLATVSSDAQGRFIYAMEAPDLKQSLPAGEHPIEFDIIKFYGNDTITGYQAEADYSEGRRGLLQVNGVYPLAGNMFGNDTIFSIQVHVGDRLTISGNYFHPPAVTIYFDDTAVSTVKTNSSGFFNTTVTVPSTTGGNHKIIVKDFIISQTTTAATTTTTPTTTTTATTTTTTTTATTATTTSSTMATATSPMTTQTTTTTTAQTSPTTSTSTTFTTSTSSKTNKPSETTSFSSTTSYSTSSATSPAGSGSDIFMPTIWGLLLIVMITVSAAFLLGVRRK
ncbi:MAG: hypothetical protein ACUVQ8_03620 [Nitrososphaeria archaeon]